MDTQAFAQDALQIKPLLGNHKPLALSLSHTHVRKSSMHALIIAGVLVVGVGLAFTVKAVGVDFAGASFASSFLNASLYGSFITLSYDMVVLHGGGAALSGLVLSAPVATNVLGCMLALIIERHQHVPYRSCMVIAVYMLGLNLIACWVVAASPDISPNMLMLARLIEGVLAGMICFWKFTLMEAEVSESEVEGAMLWEGIGSFTGMSCGPVMTALGEKLFNGLINDRAFTATAASMYFPLLLILPCGSAIANFRIVEDIEKQPNAHHVSYDMVSSAKPFQWAAFASGLTILTLTHWAWQSIEVGTAFLLELIYGMETKKIALLVGASLLTILPSAGVLGTLLGKLEFSMQLKATTIGLVVNVLACFLFMPVSLQGTHCWLFILIGDVIISGVSVSIAGTLQTHLLLICKGRLSWGITNFIFTTCFSLRSCAGPLMRTLIATSSGDHQLHYALAQMILAACVVVLSIVFTCTIEDPETLGQQIADPPSVSAYSFLDMRLPIAPMPLRVLSMISCLVQGCGAVIIWFSEALVSTAWCRYAQYVLYLLVLQYLCECILALVPGVTMLLNWTPRDLLMHHGSFGILMFLTTWQAFSDSGLFIDLLSSHLSLRLILAAAFFMSFQEAWTVFMTWWDPLPPWLSAVKVWLVWIVLAQGVTMSIPCSVLTAANCYWPLFRESQKWIFLLQVAVTGIVAPGYCLFYHVPLLYNFTKHQKLWLEDDLPTSAPTRDHGSQLDCTSSGPATTSDDVAKVALSFHQEKDFKKVYVTLEEGLVKHPNDANLAWMFARACYDIGSEHVAQGDTDGAVQIFTKGLGHAQAAVKSGAELSPAYKWNAILLGKLGEYSSTKDKIKNSFLIKELALKAAELDPNDSTTQHLLGYWCYSVASLRWLERTAASYIFATPPESSMEEAEKFLLRANELKPTMFENCMVLGDICAATSDRLDEAKKWYKQLLAIPCQSEKEKALHKEASSKLAGL